MKYYSTNKQAPVASLEEAVVKGLAGDKGLYMPEYIDSLDEEVIANMKNQSFLASQGKQINIEFCFS